MTSWSAAARLIGLTWNSMRQAVLLMGLTGRCTSQDVKAKGVRVDKALLNALISALGSAGLAQEALAVFRSMVSTIEQQSLNATPPASSPRRVPFHQDTRPLALLVDPASPVKDKH